MPDSEPTPERLADLLNDERARRAWAEHQLLAEKEKTRVWRARAVERAAEIRRLKWRRRGRKPPAPSEPPAPVAETVPEPHRSFPLYAAVLAAELDAPPWLHESFDTVPLDQPGVQMEGVDLVVVGSDRAFDHLEDWLGWEARPPLVITGEVDPGMWSEHVRRTDVAIGAAIGPAQVLEERPVLSTASPLASPAQTWTTVDESVTLESILLSASKGAALAWHSDSPLPTALDGIVVAGSGGDPQKQSVRGRLRARRRFGLPAFLETLARQAGMSLPSALPTVGVLLVTNRPDRLSEALEVVGRFEYPRAEVVVGLHGAGFDDGLVESWSERTGRPATQLRFPEGMTLGECLNRCASATSAAILVKLDDDDIYGPWYLDEAVDVAATTGADLVGKATFSMLLEDAGDLVLQTLGKENAEVAYVPGASFVVPRRTWEQVPFAHRRSRVDSTFVRGMRSRGMSIWSSSRYEFVVRRSSAGHTWQTSEQLLKAQGERIGDASRWSDLMLDT